MDLGIHPVLDSLLLTYSNTCYILDDHCSNPIFSSLLSSLKERTFLVEFHLYILSSRVSLRHTRKHLNMPILTTRSH
jgi:hypothetical protein